MSITKSAPPIAHAIVNAHLELERLHKLDSPSASCSLICSLSPGILTTLANLVGLIVLNIFHYHYFSIASAIGALAGGHTIYKSYQARELKTFQKNNAELKSSVETLNIQNEKLTQINAAQSQEYEKIASTATRLTETAGTLQIENDELKRSNHQLNGMVNNLERINNSFEQTANTHVQRLEGLNQSLNGIQHATEKDHTQFADHLGTLVEEVKKLQEANTQFNQTGATFEQTTSSLLQTAQLLQNIFTKINQWKNEKYVAYLIQTQQSLSAQVLALEQQIARCEGHNLQEKRNLDELERIKVGFERAIGTIQQETLTLETVANKFEKITKPYIAEK